MKHPAIRTKHKIVAGVEAELLKRVRTQNGLFRMELARELHLAPSTAGIYVDRLKREGFLLESDRIDRKSGRRPTLLTPNPAAGRFVGVDFEAHSLMTTVVDFSLGIVRHSQHTVSMGDTVERILKRVVDSIASGMKDESSPLLGVGVGMPGVIDTEKGTASHYEFVKGWENVPVVKRLTEKFGVPVHVENNIRSMAMAELWLGQGRGLRNFVCLGVRTGIGVGVVMNGELFCGSHGAAGEIGGWPVPGAPERSRGHAGPTLETAASLNRILKDASAATGRKLDLAALRTAVQMGDRNVQRVLDQAAMIHSATIHQLHLLFDPERIILVGPLAELGAAFLTPVTVNLRPRFDGAVPVIVNSTFGQFGGALGAAALALHRWKPNRRPPAHSASR